MERPKVIVKRKRDDALHDPNRFLAGFVEEFARSYGVLDSPDVSRLIGNIRSRSFATAVQVADSLATQTYGEHEEHFVMNQLASFVRKVPFSDPLLTPESTAWSKFLQAEEACRETNLRILSEKLNGYRPHSQIRERARSWIRKVIGYKPNLKRIYERCDFGPGASVGVHGQETHKAKKLVSNWTCTPAASAYARSSMIGDHHVWELLTGREIVCYDPEVFKSLFDRRLSYTAANKIVMVPKTAKVHRTIAIEPILNGYIQKGCDEYMRACLHRHGIDLTDQTVNQHLAMLGSQGGPNPFCTIDLSAASDSLSIEVIRDLLPPDWFTFLNAIRSPCYESEWGSGRYSKFTSMGNGFCFPLETLIFSSIVHAVYEETVPLSERGEDGWNRYSNCPRIDWIVYGDDIIVRQRSALLVIEVLNYLGFEVNSDKTFLFGSFRESCGADYFDGINVRPYSLDFIPVTYRDLFKIANGLSASHFHVSLSTWRYVVEQIPEKFRFLRPCDGPPDTAVRAPLDICMSSKHVKWSQDLQTWVWREYVTRPVADSKAYLAAIEMYGLLRGQRSNSSGHVEFPYRRKTRTGTRWVPGVPTGPNKGIKHFTNARYFV
jgi:hypothetical protein